MSKFSDFVNMRKTKFIPMNIYIIYEELFQVKIKISTQKVKIIHQNVSTVKKII